MYMYKCLTEVSAGGQVMNCEDSLPGCLLAVDGELDRCGRWEGVRWIEGGLERRLGGGLTEGCRLGGWVGLIPAKGGLECVSAGLTNN